MGILVLPGFRVTVLASNTDNKQACYRLKDYCQPAGISMVNRWLNNIQNHFFPPTCLLCGEDGEGNRDLCTNCHTELPQHHNACRICALPLEGNHHGFICGRCQQHPPAYNSSSIPFRYEPPVSQLLTQLKFQRRLAYARLLGDLMATALWERNLPVPELLIPVPLHALRLRERGYNQALELARPISRHLQVPLDYSTCQRVRATAAQSDLKADERRRNIKGAFHLRQPINARHVAIIDDVVTTGHTVNELARILRKAGVEHIEVWALARAT